MSLADIGAIFSGLQRVHAIEDAGEIEDRGIHAEQHQSQDLDPQRAAVDVVFRLPDERQQASHDICGQSGHGPGHESVHRRHRQLLQESQHAQVEDSHRANDQGQADEVHGHQDGPKPFIVDDEAS